MIDLAYDLMVEQLLYSGQVPKDKHSFLKDSMLIANERSTLDDHKYIMPVMVRVYCEKQYDIARSPARFYELCSMSTQPLIPAFKMMPPRPYGILKFDPQAELMALLAQNIVDMLNIVVEFKSFEE
jgi:hypothetical protein